MDQYVILTFVRKFVLDLRDLADSGLDFGISESGKSRDAARTDLTESVYKVVL